MTRDECKILVKGMKAVYADPKFIADQDAFDVWFGLLGDLDYLTASKALQRYMMTSDFPPTPAAIRKNYAALTTMGKITGMEAWSLVSKALRNSAYDSEAEYEKLPPLIQKAIGAPQQLFIWATDENYNEGVTRSNFLRSYDMAVERDKENSQLPESMREMIDSVNTKLEGGSSYGTTM